ncbi:MAG: hypothetical protein FJ278_08120 [Planctomycetes bacterium]|nr:hypothetical protein [Planctomycetota bacterium]
MTNCMALAALVVLLSAAAAAQEAKKPAVTPGTAGGWPEILQPPATDLGKVKEKLMLVSWGDLFYFFGPETDPGLYTRDQIRRMMVAWKKQGFTQVYWRSEHVPMDDWKWNTSTTYADASFLKAESDRIHRACDTTQAAIELARENGLKFFLWHSVYDEGTPPDQKHRLWGTFPWRHTFFDERPGMDTVDRRGGVQWGIPEMAYPAVRQRKIQQYADFLRKYDADGVLVYLHSHSAPGLHGDQYGFNPPIVAEYQKRHGVDILTDARFDCTSPSFDQRDPAVEQWRALRGEYLTQFLREFRAALRTLRPNLQIAINTQGGDYFGPPFGNMKMEWRRWIQEGLIDVLILRTWMAGGCGAYDFGKEHYLTWADKNVGVLPYEEFRKVIDESGRKVQLITRVRTYIPAADGYYDSVNRDIRYPKLQRQEQLAENLARHGRIGWIEQDFEGCAPLEQKGYLDFRLGGPRYFLGDPRYYASRNSSPGWAGALTSDRANPPALVDLSPVGGKGFAVFLKAGARVLAITRRAGSDWPDEPISRGKAILSFDLHRTPDAGTSPSSFLASTLLNQRYLDRPPAATDKNLQLKITEAGALSVWNGKDWSAAAGSLDGRAWTKVSLEMDFGTGVHRPSVNGQPAAAGGSFDPSKLAFDGIGFAPLTGAAYVDNVSVSWSW